MIFVEAFITSVGGFRAALVFHVLKGPIIIFFIGQLLVSDHYRSRDDSSRKGLSRPSRVPSYLPDEELRLSEGTEIAQNQRRSWSRLLGQYV